MATNNLRSRIKLFRCFSILAIVVLLCLSSLLHAQSTAERLMADLACGACHRGSPSPTEIQLQAPPLSFAGERYHPAYLFAYLGSPARVRPHIGKARMPDFVLDEAERVALTLYLAEQRRLPASLPVLPDNGASRAPRVADAKNLLTAELQCTACHRLWGEGRDLAVDLELLGVRSGVAWLRSYLAYPQAYEPHTAMPAVFYFLSHDGTSLQEAFPQAGEKLELTVAYLDSIARPRRTFLENEWERARQRHPAITPALGERMFKALNCAGCHRHEGSVPLANGPDLGRIRTQVRKEWLTNYLASPTPIRPAGYRPGSGSRMPDFKLSPEEAVLIAEELTKNDIATHIHPPTPSPFARRKWEQTLHEQLPCLGCHRFGGDGGILAPDLTNVSRRLRPEYVLEMIRSPRTTAPESIMPHTAMSDAEQAALAEVLLERRTSPDPTSYVSFTELPPDSPEENDTVEGLYRRLCAPCHGSEGKGDGFNARYLPVQPALHSSAAAMSERSDDTLFDAIFAGGTVVNRNHRMPAFGGTLSREQIWALVRYIRTLCRCEGPEWSRR